MTKPKKFTPTPLSTAVAPARRRHRKLIEAASSWQAERPQPVDPDLFALICAAAEDSWDPEVTATRWTRTGVASMARCRIPNWCSSHSCLWPEQHLEAMWAWFDFLHETGRMDPESDPVAELRKPLACCGHLDQDGRALPLDAERQIECECALPYRETTALLNQLVLQCERSGADPIQVLRGQIGASTTGWGPLLIGDDGDSLDRYGWAGPPGDPYPSDLD